MLGRRLELPAVRQAEDLRLYAADRALDGDAGLGQSIAVLQLDLGRAVGGIADADRADAIGAEGKQDPEIVSSVDLREF